MLKKTCYAIRWAVALIIVPLTPLFLIYYPLAHSMGPGTEHPLQPIVLVVSLGAPPLVWISLPIFHLAMRRKQKTLLSHMVVAAVFGVVCAIPFYLSILVTFPVALMLGFMLWATFAIRCAEEGGERREVPGR